MIGAFPFLNDTVKGADVAAHRPDDTSLTS